VRTPHAGTLSTNLAVGTTTSEEILCNHTTNTIVPPKGVLDTENEANGPLVSVLKGVGISMPMLPWETLYMLQDGVTADCGPGRIACSR